MSRVRTKYHWPALQLNFWLLIMLVGSATILGVFANFITIQNQLRLGIPWFVLPFPFSIAHCPLSMCHPNAAHSLMTLNRYFPYWITAASLGVLFIIIMLWLISQRQLLPGIVIMGSFILFILWMVGLIVVSIELWGPTGSVNGNCNLYVSGRQSTGSSIETLAWLEQHSICESPCSRNQNPVTY